MRKFGALVLAVLLIACGTSGDDAGAQSNVGGESSQAAGGDGGAAGGPVGGAAAGGFGGSGAGGGGGAPAFVWPISNSSTADADFVRHPYGPRWIGRYDFHAGIDINIAIGTAVHAIADGTVIATRMWDGLPSPSAGTNVLIAHADDRFSAYLHMSELRVNVGDALMQGSVLGLSGDTGANTPHLHLTCMVGLNGPQSDERRSVNPLLWLPHTERAPIVQRDGDGWQLQLSAPHMRLARIVMQGGNETHDASYAAIVALGSQARDAEEHFGVGFAMDSGPDSLGLFELTLRPDPTESGLALQLYDIDGALIAESP